MSGATQERLSTQMSFLEMAHHFAQLPLAADTLSLPPLQSLMIPGHRPTLLGTLPEDQHDHVLSRSNAV